MKEKERYEVIVNKKNFIEIQDIESNADTFITEDNIEDLLNQQDKENQQLKQSQNQKAIEELNNLKRYCHEWYSWSDVAKRLDEIVDDRIKELGGGENE